MSTDSNPPSNSRLSGRILVPILIVGILLGTAVSVYVFQRTDHAFDDEIICRENLKQIGLALFAYQARHGSFPPAYLVDTDGKPTNSWRTLLLPFLSEPEARQLAHYYRFDKPWDSSENRAAQGNFMPLAYKCPSPQRSRLAFGHAHFVAIVGEGTAWPGPIGRSIKDEGRTVLLVEYAKDDIVWTEPRDVLWKDLAAGSLAQLGLGSPTGKPPMVLYSDGTVERLANERNAADLAETATLKSNTPPR